MNKAIFNLGIATLYQEITSRLIRANQPFRTDYDMASNCPEVSVTVNIPSDAIGKPDFAILYLVDSIYKPQQIRLSVHLKRAADAEHPDVIHTEYGDPEEAWDALMEILGGAE